MIKSIISEQEKPQTNPKLKAYVIREGQANSTGYVQISSHRRKQAISPPLVLTKYQDYYRYQVADIQLLQTGLTEKVFNAICFSQLMFTREYFRGLLVQRNVVPGMLIVYTFNYRFVFAWSGMVLEFISAKASKLDENMKTFATITEYPKPILLDYHNSHIEESDSEPGRLQECYESKIGEQVTKGILAEMLQSSVVVEATRKYKSMLQTFPVSLTYESLMKLEEHFGPVRTYDDGVTSWNVHGMDGIEVKMHTGGKETTQGVVYLSVGSQSSGIQLRAVRRKNAGALLQDPYQKGLINVYATGEKRNPKWKSLPFIGSKQRLPRESQYTGNDE